MIKKLLCLVAAAALAPLASGCGYSCDDMCADAEDGGCGTDNCVSDCEKWEQISADAGCEDEWDEVMSCASDNSDDACAEDSTACDAESTAYGACITPYCTENPAECT